ncbi:MAG TPA: hypothetical protein VGZ22_10090 [Isosphaeraceae bacterium]|jgi:hypothetical protein|nr:hypothetical protein [Isosphaeraceae bacterium]
MAAIQVRNGSCRILFRYSGKQYSYTLGKVTNEEAEKTAHNVEFVLMRLKQGLINLPAGTALVSFVQQGGIVPVTTNGQPIERHAPTLADLRDRYLETHGNGSLEARTLEGMRLHFKHLAAVLGEYFSIRQLALEHLQGYVDRRTKAKGIRGWLSPATIKKEIVTLRTAWNWGAKMRFVAGRFPSYGLRYPKCDEKPLFQTRDEIKRQLKGLSDAAAADLWEALYLRQARDRSTTGVHS